MHAICKPGLWPREVQGVPAPSRILRSEEAAVVGGVNDAWFASMRGELAHRRALCLRQATHCLLPSIEPSLPIEEEERKLHHALKLSAAAAATFAALVTAEATGRLGAGRSLWPRRWSGAPRSPLLPRLASWQRRSRPVPPLTPTVPLFKSYLLPGTPLSPSCAGEPID